MTTQIPDTVVDVDGKVYYPIQSMRRLFGFGKPGCASGNSTACWDGYTHHYSITDKGVLYLQWVLLHPSRKETPPPEFGKEPVVLPEEIKALVWNYDFYMKEDKGEVFYAYGPFNPSTYWLYLKGCQFMMRGADEKTTALLRVSGRMKTEVL